MNKLLSSKSRPLSLAFSLILLTAACSDSGSRRIDPAGSCRNGYDPIQMEVSGAEKLSLELSDKKIPPGNYAYAGAEVFIQDKLDENELVIHVRDQKVEGKEEFNGSGLCVRGFRTGLSVSYEASGISSMTVDADNKADILTRTFPIQFDETGRNLDFKDGSSLKNESPSKVFQGKPTTQSEYALFKISETDFEVRSIDSYPDGLVIKLITRLTRSDLAPVVAADEAAPLVENAPADPQAETPIQ